MLGLKKPLVMLKENYLSFEICKALIPNDVHKFRTIKTFFYSTDKNNRIDLKIRSKL